MLEDKGKNKGRIKEIWAAHDSGKVVNPIAIQGQIEGGVLMSMGYALTERFPLKDGVPQVKCGTLGLLHATDIPDIHAIYVEKEHLLPVSYGGKGIGEIASIGTAPAVANAYQQLDGELCRHAAAPGHALYEASYRGRRAPVASPGRCS